MVICSFVDLFFVVMRQMRACINADGKGSILIPKSASGGPILGEAVGVASWMGLSTGLD